MNDAIKLAIEKGGYEAEFDPYDEHNILLKGEERRIILDPLFWQALSKALGQPQCNCGKKICSVREWDMMAHEYLHLILIGGDTEMFWKELLNSK